jgi:hypothetical protein
VFGDRFGAPGGGDAFAQRLTLEVVRQLVQ